MARKSRNNQTIPMLVPVAAIYPVYAAVVRTAAAWAASGSSPDAIAAAAHDSLLPATNALASSLADHSGVSSGVAIPCPTRRRRRQDRTPPTVCSWSITHQNFATGVAVELVAPADPSLPRHRREPQRDAVELGDRRPDRADGRRERPRHAERACFPSSPPNGPSSHATNCDESIALSTVRFLGSSETSAKSLLEMY